MARALNRVQLWCTDLGIVIPDTCHALRISQLFNLQLFVYQFFKVSVENVSVLQNFQTFSQASRAPGSCFPTPSSHTLTHTHTHTCTHGITTRSRMHALPQRTRRVVTFDRYSSVHQAAGGLLAAVPDALAGIRSGEQHVLHPYIRGP